MSPRSSSAEMLTATTRSVRVETSAKTCARMRGIAPRPRKLPQGPRMLSVFPDPCGPPVMRAVLMPWSVCSTRGCTAKRKTSSWPAVGGKMPSRQKLWLRMLLLGPEAGFSGTRIVTVSPCVLHAVAVSTLH